MNQSIPTTCRDCGACCHGRPETILVHDADLVRWKREGREDILAQITPGHFSQQAFAMKNGACVHQGTAESSTDCSIYEARGTTCRTFEMGSRQCLEFRRERGIV